MHFIWSNYKQDLKNIFTNAITLITVIGLVLLPSLYAWFNIAANWDPYSATKGIKVAVVNLDQGSTVGDKPINLGNQIVDELHKNDQLGWQFVSANDADYGVKQGQYYASITIPSDFSNNLLTIITPNKIHSELIYVINEKANAIAPKITASGANTLKNNITQNIISTADTIVFDVFHELGVNIERNLPKIKHAIGILSYLDTQGETLEQDLPKYYHAAAMTNDTLSNVIQSLPDFKNTLYTVQNIATDSNGILTDTITISNSLTQIIESAFSFVLDFSKDTMLLMDTLEANLNNAHTVQKILTTLDTRLNSLNQLVTSLASKLVMVYDFIPLPSLQSLIESTNSLATDLKNLALETQSFLQMAQSGQVFALENIDKLQKGLGNVITKTENNLILFQQNIAPHFSDMLSGSVDVTQKVATLTQSFIDEMPNLQTILATAKQGIAQLESALKTAEKELPALNQEIHLIYQKLAFLTNSKNLDEIMALLQNDPALVASYLASPIVLKEQSLYTIPNYGSAMAPFYTTLAIWVGCVILTAILSTEVHEANVHDDKSHGVASWQVYLSKGLLFMTLSLFQTIIIILGDYYLLNVYFDNFIAFLVLGILTSLTFTFVIYTLVSVLGNIGKGLTIILLVLQISSSGGTFPVEVTPPFFQKISSYLPFTYAISALREAQGGIVRASLMYNVFYLLVFIATFLILGIILKPLLHNFNEKFTDSFKRSGLGE